jgi:hypothetical protein
MASSTSMPRYRTVLSILVWPSKSWTGDQFLITDAHDGGKVAFLVPRDSLSDYLMSWN